MVPRPRATRCRTMAGSSRIYCLMSATPRRRNSINFCPVAISRFCRRRSLNERKPDFLLILAWNIAGEIAREQSLSGNGVVKLCYSCPEIRTLK